MVEHSTTFAGAYLPLHFQLKLIWERLMGRPVRDVTWNFFECGGTPELAETMLKEASAETGQQITTAAFLKNPTIAGLADAVLSAADRDELSEVQRGNGEAPFFFLHGDILGGGFYTRGLAEDIGSECPFFSVPMPPVTRESSSTIEEAAARYCAAIRERKARGPYVLGGFSLAALFAYEVARQLSPEGEEVEALVLIDPDLPTAFERLCLRAIDSRKKAESFGAKVDSFTTVYCKLAQLSYVWQSPLREKARFVWRNTTKLFRRRNGNATSATEPASVEEIDDDWRVDIFQWLATAYSLKPYAGSVTLMLTDAQMKARPTLVRRWRRAVSQLRVQRLPGSHMTAITTHRAALAEKIREELRMAHP